MSLFDLTALQLGAAIRAGEVSARDAAKASLDAIAARQGENNAFITVLAEQAMAQAKALDEDKEKLAVGPLAGVPAGVKDNICTLDVKTSCASKILGEFAPPYDATVMEKFRAAGGVMVGKLNMDEFAMGSTTETSFYGPACNPWDLERVPGGSSGGAAAAVAAGECWYALGTRYRRLHPPARLLLRRHRHEAHLRHRLPLRPHRLRFLP